MPPFDIRGARGRGNPRPRRRAARRIPTHLYTPLTGAGRRSTPRRVVMRNHRAVVTKQAYRPNPRNVISHAAATGQRRKVRGLSSRQQELARQAVVTARRLRASRKVKRAVLAAGLVESNLRNLRYGDRDSLGYLQQRRSTGWRRPMSVSGATADFVRGAQGIEDQYPTAGTLAQAVQRSAYPSRYSERELDAARILRELEDQSLAARLRYRSRL